MWGNGARRKCPECGQDVWNLSDALLSVRELRGPRNITSSNVDRLFDDGGRRFLAIEEKRPDEGVPGGQHQLLRALARLPMFTVWLARGTPQSLEITDFREDAAQGPFLEGISFDGYQDAVTRWFARAPIQQNRTNGNGSSQIVQRVTPYRATPITLPFGGEH